ncbi:MAG TPA: NAD-binding protein [Candidatus Dormibacteraeota bacterium]|nr:NAD-binding protein [Candidatus Dormibacteraeota bacterium]
MRIVVVGAGTLGTQVSRALAAGGNTVSLVELDPERLAVVGSTLPGVELVVGDGCDLSVLEAAGALGADVLVAVTGHDEDNLVASLLAKRRCRVSQVVARVNDPDDQWLFGEGWGVDVAVSTASAMVSLIEEATRSVATVDLLRLRRAGLDLLETTLEPASAAVGRQVQELGLPSGLVIIAVIRQGDPLRPEVAGALEPGDQVLLLARQVDVADVEALFQRQR